ncbi:MAG: hypothetical protein WC759_02790 [Candidatus Micrarchaeia archaeon]|jgi:hypothetical protein
MAEIKKQKLPLLALLAVVLLAMLFAGCTAPGIKPLDEQLSTTAPAVNPACESCACFVCERSDQAAAGDDVGLGGLSSSDLASIGGSSLQGGHCWFQKCDGNLKKEIQSSNGKIAQKTLMLGAGSDSLEFKADMKYCPMIDESCYFGQIGGRERWQNVLRAAGTTDEELDYTHQRWLEEYEKSITKPLLISDFGAGSFIASKGLSIDNFACLFSGSKDQSYPADASTADTRLFCSSGSCNKGVVYRAMCRKDADGINGVNYAPPATGGQYPADEVPCECRHISKYDADHDLFFERTVSNPDELAGQLLCHSNVLKSTPSAAPFVQQCGGTAAGTCVRSYFVGAEEYCLEWTVDQPGNCEADADNNLQLNEYGICEGCTPTMELAPMGRNYEDFPTDLNQDLAGTASNGPPLIYEHNGFLNRNIIPVMYVRQWANGGYAVTPGGAAVAIAQYAVDPANKFYPLIFALNSNDFALASTLKSICLPDPTPIEIKDEAGAVIQRIWKQSCLVSILDDGSTLTPIPPGSLDNVDLLEAEKTISCPDATTMVPAFNGIGTEPLIINQLISSAKEVQEQYGPASAQEKPIGWLLTATFACPTGEAAQTLMSKQSLDKLSNAGFIGIIAQGLDKPYSDGAISIDLDTNDAFVSHALPATDSFNFFEGCANYYNGTKQTYYIRQIPQQCQCLPCDPAIPGDCNPFCGTSGLTCTGSDGTPADAGATDVKCEANCLPFPDTTDPAFDPYYVCPADPSLLTPEDLAQGCNVICNVRTAGFLNINERTLNTPPALSSRGTVTPEPGYNSLNTEGHVRFTPTNCYIQDSDVNAFNIYKYQRTPLSNPSSNEFVIFDRKGEANECGRTDITSILGDTAPCAIPDELPAVVIK